MPIQNHRALFDSAPDGILVVDRQGVIRDANPEAERLFGYASHELEGEAIELLVPEEYRKRHRGHRDRYHGTSSRRPMGIGMELVARRRDGSTFPVEVSLNGMDVAGETLTVATVRDVSDRKRLRDFGAGALRAAEEVRSRIARDLHDDTAQRLSAHLIRLRLVERAATEEERREHLRELREGLMETAEGVRRIARGLRPPELEDAGLAAALQAHARALSDSYGLRTTLDVEGVERYLTPDGLLVLYRIMQEALTNVARHAGAAEASVSIRLNGMGIEAEVRDAGAGFDPDRLDLGGRGLGLMGMRERAVMVGGVLAVESRPGSGTRVSVRIPVEFDLEVERV
ncbi:MAG: PAS domain S-box protein [Longimicrobiales bacterium]|nr:PAS domain S-box protein [Longimicrobiales bacterium]